jgi:hypothetical protein
VIICIRCGRDKQVGIVTFASEPLSDDERLGERPDAGDGESRSDDDDDDDDDVADAMSGCLVFIIFISDRISFIALVCAFSCLFCDLNIENNKLRTQTHAKQKHIHTRDSVQ